MIKVIYCYCMAICIASIAFSSVPTSKVLKGITERFEKISDFKSLIRQTTVDALGNKSIYEGEVYFKKPNKIRMVYFEKSKLVPGQIVITDGDCIWIYTAELKQVTKQPINAKSLPLPLLILGGVSQMDTTFKEKNYIKPIERLVFGKNTVLQISLKPKNRNRDYKEQSIWVDHNSYLPVKSELKDYQGNITTVLFTQITCNSQLADSFFIMEKKEGIQFVDMMKP